MKNKKIPFGLNTVRKKVLLLSKSVGGIIVLFYLCTLEIYEDRSAAFWIWFGLMVFVILFVDFLLWKMISKPLNEINDTAREMAELNFSAYCSVKTDDEFGELSSNLNIMFSKLQDTLSKLEAANGKLEAANGKLERDVERERLLQLQRKELSENLSHEMKTPLGLIQAYTEGLKEEADSGKRQQYIESILAATDRMNNIIISLLDLSALESGAAELSNESFDFIELVETEAGRLLIDTPGINYRLFYELPEDKVFINADKHRIEQVLNNLTENAKKYVSLDGEIRLTVRVSDSFVSFSIYNQGEYIKEEEFPKLWMKFYRRQNNHSSGSGLGLAIVSQILEMYHVPYGAENFEKGVRFYFQFPITK